ncbi:hypothetical protein LTR70_010588 [Exophiala xenobiotica]|uniref:NACHT domain-containing protein n=1 Tax=Lithohypha guttulata TaxID=1690604 RepID=A0ABR0JTM0_9EURO|nr:hypothetical protein LTR24_010560 [Lithohypha guttulata]KAK5309119.1 hypothetical protein LTR70_010588 [Exophiala xenobiotica]
MATRRSLPIEQYQVGVICALRHEMTAAIATLDERHQPITCQDKLDPNNYVVGRIHDHNVVIACLPAGVYGTNAAARVANDMLRTFTGLRFGLMVGIGGGIPNLHKGLDIRLGDVVISQPDETFGEWSRFLKPPPTILLAALSTLQAEHDLEDSKVPTILADMVKKHPNLVKNGYGSPGQENDTLYCPQCGGSSSSSSCNLCTDGKIERAARDDHHPAFWYGVIASGNQLMKNAAERDRMSQGFGALCVEMEAAGLMNDFPCIVIRGICDYADSHKNDAWQKYAALAAAAYAKEFLEYISAKQTRLEKPIEDIVEGLDKQFQLMEEHLQEVKQENKKQDQRYQSNKHRDCHIVFKTSTYELFKNVNPDRVEGTCRWVLSHPQYLRWNTILHDDLLWISADPGCGKSVLAKSLIDNELRNTDKHTVCYFFFKDNDEQDNLATALCTLLHQLFTRQPQLIQYALSAWEKTGTNWDDQAHDVTCVLDALDECRLTDRWWLIDMLARLYTQVLPSESGTRRGRLKFLVTSRPYDNIRAGFQKTLDNLPTIQLRGEEENEQIHQEIDLAIRMRVAQLAKDLKLHRPIKEQLETRLLEMEHRTYLWLYLAIEGIYETYQNSFRPEEAAIKSLPSTVENAYEKILSRVKEEQRGNVKKILQIVVGARRPLTVHEMAVALGLATSTQPKSLHDARIDPVRLETNIRHWCGLFVFINHARIYLIHQTAKEFLICDSGSAALLSGWKHCLNPQVIEQDMARICGAFLSLRDSWPTAQSLVRKLKTDGRIGDSAQSLVRKLKTDGRIDDFLEKDDHVESLLVYSAEYWASHLRDADM